MGKYASESNKIKVGGEYVLENAQDAANLI